MTLDKNQRAGILKGVQDVRAAMSKFESVQKDLNEKVGKLKTLAGTTAGNADQVLNDALRVMGQEVEKLGGWGEE